MPRRIAASFPAACVLMACLAPARADEPRPPLVPAFERFHAAAPGVEGGRLLLGELNCTSCHAASDDLAGHVERKQAPILDNVADRVRLEWMRAFIADPLGTKPGTTMPSVLAALTESERAEAAEALVHFLSTTGAIADTPPETKHVAEGRRLFHEIGCTACHEPLEGLPVALATGVPLPEKIEAKYSVESLTRFLENPLAVRLSGRMPGQKWQGEEARQVAHYLMRNLEGVVPPELRDRPRVPYRYYEGSWDRVPDFASLEPKAEGLGAAFAIGLRERDENFALVWDAVLEVERGGRHTFTLASDDGSKLWIDGGLVVDHDGVHASEEKEGRIELESGVHEVRVAMFEANGEESLDVFVSGPGLPRQYLANVVAASIDDLRAEPPAEPEPADENAFVFDEAKAKRGRELFTSLGCANCHELKGVMPTLVAKPLADLDGAGDCLAPEPHAGRPFHALDEAQRSALRAAVTSAGEPLPEPTLAERIHHTMTRHNCYTCHVRGETGGVERERDSLFEITQQEMGDEGRLPPPLDGVGAKLATNWLRDHLAKGGDDRPYMKVRMPAFGEKNVGHLVADFEAADPLPEPVAIPEIDMVERRIEAEGRKLVGDQVFGCIKCHNFNGIAGTGVQSIDLVIVTRRLKHDWFHAYMLNPQAFRPGTRMPAAWPLGQSTVPGILDGDAAKQIEGIWIYLADGGSAKVPMGLERDPIVLVAVEQPVVYRNFIQGAGVRAIGVAYPQQANLAWDANEFRAALIWQGQFIDASKHWIGRGPGFQAPLGDQVVPLETHTPIARLESPNDPWPTTPAKDRGYRFLGYRYAEDRRPVFRYEFADVIVEDEFTGVATKPYPSLVRTIRVSSRGISPDVENVWFRAAIAEEITKLEGGWYAAGNNVRLRFGSTAEPTIVDVGGEQELRLPLREELRIEIAW